METNAPMSLLDLQRIVDHAAAKDDRWLFLAMLALMIVAATVIIRWMAAWNRSLFDECKKQTEELKVVVITNTQALTQNSASLQSFEATIRERVHGSSRRG